MLKEFEHYFKKMIKRKEKYTKALLITFLMTGALGFSVPITPNANGEYIVNSGTGDGEVYISGGTRNIFKVDDGKKLTFTGAGDVFSTMATTPPTPRPLITISGSNTEFFGTGITNKAEFSSEDNIVLYSVKGIGGNYINGSNQKVTFKNMKAGDASISSGEPAIKVEAKNGNNIKGAEFNLIGTTNNDDDEFGIAQNSNWVVEVEGDAINNKYSELTVNVKGNTSITGLMHKEVKSVINVNLEDGGKWSFSKNYKNGSTTTTINSLNIGNDGILDVTFYPSESDGETGIYTMKLTSDGINNDGTLTNAGEINLYNGSYKDVFTIEGNYHGNNGNIIMNTLWNAPGGENGENSESDLVYITGNASGSTRVSPSSFEDEADYNIIDGTIQQLSTRLNSVPVVKVAGNSSPTTFTGTAKTTGAAEAQLTSRQVNGIWEYYWTIAPLGNANLGVIPGTGTTTGSNGGQNTSSKPIYIMAQPVSSYVLMPKVNLEMGYETVGTLHERRGENQILNLENMSKDKGQIWTRIFGHGLNEKGKERFEYESDIYGVQVGHDFKINEDSKGNTHLLGGYISYNRANTDFFDKYRAENGYISDDKFTGKGKSESVSLGLTKTKYTQNGSYYDLVGQMSFLQNKYNSRDDYAAKQKGYGLLLSAEVGRPFKFSKSVNGTSWSIEPQAQLSYQHLHIKSFNDGLRSVNQDNRNGLRTRAGVRISYDKNSEVTNRTNTYYAVANVWHDLTKNNNRATNIGLDKVSEKYGKTWGEIGIGAQAPVGQKSNLYVDTRYEHSFGNENRSGYKGTIGFKHTF
ncbi:autotransporter outer membrane beta-barrel domain-containing protein [Leptotrichia sp. oral taxon 218]|uniref:autotransporter family protein n=1 Tax=Leptotrichia sp. oral taxon 218 TaxID=712361 RepID=UPI001B8C5532|nr:autotransporter outer membrane beta-barrel domain-containing protein [Leptotrichia sp. oral taxon 218]QUB94947.1 autotransporter outer membrane beta-barrel domain-containing protein [Leptotrichia sp. oral taxon 218]